PKDVSEKPKDTSEKSEHEFHIVGDSTFVSIDGIFGPISVTGVEGSKGRVTLTRSATAREMKDAEELVKDVDVRVEYTKGGMRIESSGPQDRRKLGEYGYEISIAVTVPKGSSMQIENKFGNVSVKNV